VLTRLALPTTLTAATPGEEGGTFPVSDVVVDPNCSSHVFAALGYAGTLGQTGGGIYESTDTGLSWASITGGTDLQYSPVASLTIDPTSCASPGSCQYLWAASYGLGAWQFNTQSTACP
jgi:hypothetical protein